MLWMSSKMCWPILSWVCLIWFISWVTIAKLCKAMKWCSYSLIERSSKEGIYRRVRHASAQLGPEKFHSHGQPFSSLKRELDLQEAFTAFVERYPKAKLVLTESAKALQIKNLQSACPSQFVSTFLSLQDMVDQFALFQRLANISDSSAMKKFVENGTSIIHMNQLMIALRPLHYVTVSSQSPNLTIAELLELPQRSINRNDSPWPRIWMKFR